MPVRPAPVAALSAALLGFAPGAAAAGVGDDVLYYTGNNGFAYLSIFGTDTFEDAVLGSCDAAIEESTALPSDLSDYRVVFLMIPRVVFSATDVATLQTYLGDGGTLVLVGESTGYTSQYLTPLNTLAADLGLNSSFLASSSYDSGCRTSTTLPSPTHPLTQGVTALDYGWSGKISVGTGGTALLTGASGQTMLAEEGGVVFMADMNLLVDSCTPTNNTGFFENLYGLSTIADCDPDGDGIDAIDCGGADCDDCDPAVGTGSWYADSDGDGFGDPAVLTPGCAAPAGTVADNTDCDDGLASVYPGAPETCNGIDDDCDTVIDDSAVDAVPWYADTDGDGFGDPSVSTTACSAPSGHIADNTDCDDGLASVYPGATETCNGVDDDCNTVTDDSAVDATAWYADSDSDGFGDASVSTTACSAPSGTVADNTDCDDSLASVYPGATETCNGVDDDCNSTVDDSAIDATDWFADRDGDGFGDPTDSERSCAAPSATVADDTDCDDDDPDAHPGATETAYDAVDSDCDGLDAPDEDGDGLQSAWVSGGDDCDDTDPSVGAGMPELADGIDNDCDGSVDEGTAWSDEDGDGFAPAGGDCDDTDPTAHPAAAERADGVDNDCDGTVDEGTTAFDDDGDGWSEDEGDCDDSLATTAPDQPELPADGVDNDCDGVVDSGRFDADGDGVLAEAGDCDDDDATVRPGAPELADGIDNDCDGTVDEGTAAFDDDGDGSSEDEGDCDDTDPATAPGSAETLDGADNDCDGLVDEGTEVFDDDGDGWSEREGDCDDADAAVFPGAEEQPNGADDDCDGLVDDATGEGDVDGDGYSENDGDCDDLNPWRAPGAPELCDEVDNDCDGETDEDDACAAGATTTEDELDGAKGDVGKGGCATGGGAGAATSGGLLALLVLGALAGRRRRVALLAAGSAACGGLENSVKYYRPALEADPVVDLGEGELGATLSGRLGLRGTGTGEVTLDAAPVDDDRFWIDDLPPTVEPGETVELGVFFAGDTADWATATLRIEGDMSDGPLAVTLRAHTADRALVAWPARVDLGPTTAAGPVRSLVLRNDGGLDEELVDATIAGPFAVAGLATPALLAPGEELLLEVHHTGDPADGAATGALAITRATGPELVVALGANDCDAGRPGDHDQDGDGVRSCGGDCDDSDAAVRPGATEVANGVDDDCDGTIDEGTVAHDDDGDGFSEEDGDCDDADSAVHPAATEVEADGRDNDCDGIADDGSHDPDGDGVTAAAGDCAPDDGAVSPAATEVANGVDDDCDGLVDEGTAAHDDDGDGLSEDDGDCDDTDAAVWPGAAEVADHRDNDCDGQVDEGTAWADDDGDGYTEDGGDCDDSDPTANPAWPEVADDGVDNDCDGLVDE